MRYICVTQWSVEQKTSGSGRKEKCILPEILLVFLHFPLSSFGKFMSAGVSDSSSQSTEVEPEVELFCCCSTCVFRYHCSAHHSCKDQFFELPWSSCQCSSCRTAAHRMDGFYSTILFKFQKLLCVKIPGDQQFLK